MSPKCLIMLFWDYGMHEKIRVAAAWHGYERAESEFRETKVQVQPLACTSCVASQCPRQLFKTLS